MYLWNPYWYLGLNVQIGETLCVTHTNTLIIQVLLLHIFWLHDSVQGRKWLALISSLDQKILDCHCAIIMIDYFIKWPSLGFTSQATSADVFFFSTLLSET